MIHAPMLTACAAPFSALQADIAPPTCPLRAAITAAWRRDEREAVHWLLAQVPAPQRTAPGAAALARRLVEAVRKERAHASGVDALMHEFSLSSEEGVALMCLAEALLRIPDKATVDRLIADKIGKGDWRRHLGESPSLFVNAATWGLLVTGRLVNTRSEQGMGAALGRLLSKGGEPLVRKGMDLAMRLLGNQFVTGQTIEQALERSRALEARGYRYSYDMLGEAALTAADAERYTAAYEQAIHAIGRAAAGRGIHAGPGISVKLSALHPRYVRAQRARVLAELLPRLKDLLLLAKRYDIGLNIDAEEADRLELSLELIAALAQDPDLAGYDGLGIVVQAYQKRCPFVIDYLVELARRTRRRFMIRLVKGAYWDAEIKRAQVDGMPGYPVYTRKAHTDLSYLVCARKLLAATDCIYPQFATHNAQTLATVYTWAEQAGVRNYEFQCLHGMGETLYDQVVGADRLNRPCRIYAPVGSHETLLPYLVRRLLENGANSSFVNQIVDQAIPLDTLLADPFAQAEQHDGLPHPAIVLPQRMFDGERLNSTGLDLNNDAELHALAQQLESWAVQRWQAHALLAAAVEVDTSLGVTEIRNPADRRDLVGTVREASEAEIEAALAAADTAAAEWAARAPQARALLLERGADLLELHRAELMALAVREAGKTLPNAVGEVREAVDFLRYYAAQSRREEPGTAFGPVVCISPWNFPLAIFIGEVSAALAAGNVVLAKPAEQTPLLAQRAAALLHEAGVPRAVLQLLPGSGETVGARLVADTRVQGVVFTGSTEVAQLINQRLARRGADEGREIALIAETGGQNAMIVDSSALPEQVVQDVLASAFDSAGQRCSALRVLCLQEEIAERTLQMLKGAMQELRIGRPDRLATDIGPVIDGDARRGLIAHIDAMRARGFPVFQLPLPDDCDQGDYVAPTVIEIDALSALSREVFGPVLHVLRYRRERLPQLLDAINATGYGLTLGLHTRIDETIARVVAQARVGNIYVNRNMIGAVVGVQPFGGEGKSGTGPKAGGPLYLKRLQRDGNWLAVTGRREVVPALQQLQHWADARGLHALAQCAATYASGSPLGSTLLLPGPTGEHNTLQLHPRGHILCAAADMQTLLNQLAACIATGNRAVLAAGCTALLPDELRPLLPAELRELDEHDQEHVPLQLALVDLNTRTQLLPQLAQREGALVQAIECSAHEVLPLWRLMAERAVCVNTTAAGGNASLMTLGS